MLRKLVLVGALVLLPSLAMAQPEAGNWELTLNGSGSNDNDFDNGAFALGGSLGYYISKELEVGLRQDINYVDLQGSNDDWAFGTRVFVDYHFDLDRWQPFVGANIGYLYGDGIVDTWAAGPEAGVKFYINKTTFVFGMVEYQWFFDNGDDIDDNFDDGRFVYSIGLGVLL